MNVRPTDCTEVVSTAAVLIERGELIAALDLLTTLDRHHRDPELEIQLVDLRARAATTVSTEPGRSEWPPSFPDPFPGSTGEIPEIDGHALDPAVLGGAVRHHGALIVRGVLTKDDAQTCATAIEHAHDQRSSPTPLGEPDDLERLRWFRPLRYGQHYGDAVLRKVMQEQGATWLADSPAATALVLDCLADAGISAALQEYLGERPCFSLQKSTLRRSVPEARYVTWHQDGAFLGPDVRTLNVWIALTSCGGSLPTPALEIVPRSMPGILPTQEDAAGFISGSVPHEIVAEQARACPAVIPEFGPGDALIFDERLLHRTHLRGDMTEIRYGLECWFFAPSHRPPDYTPLLV